jgi:phage baseplate assembly protein gpV
VTLTLFETIQRIVQEELARVRTAELALVQKQHPHASDSDTDNYACTVQLRDSGMVLKEVPVATSRMGLASIPAVGDMVLVQFIGGDINHAVITGSLYNDEDRPPANDDGEAILHLPLGAGDSDAVHIALTSGSKREIGIKLGSGLSISVRDDDPAVELDVDSGKATVKIDRDGAISIKSNGKITMEASDIDIHASGQLNLKGDSAVNIN